MADRRRRRPRDEEKKTAGTANRDKRKKAEDPLWPPRARPPFSLPRGLATAVAVGWLRGAISGTSRRIEGMAFLVHRSRDKTDAGVVLVHSNDLMDLQRTHMSSSLGEGAHVCFARDPYRRFLVTERIASGWSCCHTGLPCPANFAILGGLSCPFRSFFLFRIAGEGLPPPETVVGPSTIYDFAAQGDMPPGSLLHVAKPYGIEDWSVTQVADAEQKARLLQGVNGGVLHPPDAVFSEDGKIVIFGNANKRRLCGYLADAAREINREALLSEAIEEVTGLSPDVVRFTIHHYVQFRRELFSQKIDYERLATEELCGGREWRSLL